MTRYASVPFKVGRQTVWKEMELVLNRNGSNNGDPRYYITDAVHSYAEGNSMEGSTDIHTDFSKIFSREGANCIIEAFEIAHRHNPVDHEMTEQLRNRGFRMPSSDL